MHYLSNVLLLTVTFFGLSWGNPTLDWLITKIETPVTFNKTSFGYALDNGLIRREFMISPGFATSDFYSYERKQSILRAYEPEAVISLNGNIYNIGGVYYAGPRAYMNRSVEDIQPYSDSFQFSSYKLRKPVAPFPYAPMRGAPKDIVWPPKGLTVELVFKAPKSAPASLQNVTVTVTYEMYEGLPLLSKWVNVVDMSVHASNQPLSLALLTVEMLAVNEQWASSRVDSRNADTDSGWLYVETDQAHGTSVQWSEEPSHKIEWGSYEGVVNCSYSPIPILPLTKQGIVSFRVHELVIGSSDRERSALARHRMFRLLAPHTQENPIFFHMTNSSTDAVRAVIDQMAEVGFEMMIYSFGSGFDIESTNETYVSEIADVIKYAHSRKIEVGAYDLIALTRQAPNPEWMATDPNTHKSIGSSCFASDWYDYLLDRVLTFINKTGLSMVETDGPYGGYSCASTNHSHHHDYYDSVYWQEVLQGKFYTTLREKMVYINEPDNFFYQGGSKTGMGYDENQYSLPRWEDLSISRQSVYDNTYERIPTVGWMFVPLVVYHQGGDAAMFEPLSAHKQEYEWALAQYLGAGVAACYRGYRLYDSPETKAIVSKWVSFYKKHRDILTSDIIHVRRPDMQSIDCFMHANPFLPEKGLAMVFNPTAKTIQDTMILPLYYTGLNTTAKVSEQGLNTKVYEVARDYSIKVDVKMAPYSITWFLIQ